jgi:flagellar biosynthesis GTPase FlhF
LQLQLASLFSNWNLYGKSNSKREINEAFRHVMKALKYAEGMLYQDKLMMISCYRMYGYLYGRQGQYSLAKEYTERSVSLHESIVNRDIDALVVDYSNLALYCSALGMPDLAAVYRNKEMEVKKKADLLHETNEELIQQHKNKDPDSNPPVYDQKSSPAPEKDVREKETQEKEAQDKEAREKEAQDKEVREKEAQDKEVRENDVREKEAREKKLYSAFGWDPVKFRGSLKS